MHSRASRPVPIAPIVTILASSYGASSTSPISTAKGSSHPVVVEPSRTQSTSQQVESSPYPVASSRPVKTLPHARSRPTHPRLVASNALVPTVVEPRRAHHRVCCPVDWHSIAPYAPYTRLVAQLISRLRVQSSHVQSTTRPRARSGRVQLTSRDASMRPVAPNAPVVSRPDIPTVASAAQSSGTQSHLTPQHASS